MTPKSLRALTTRPFCGAGDNIAAVPLTVMFKDGAVVFTTGGEHTHYSRYTLPSFCITASGKQNNYGPCSSSIPARTSKIQRKFAV